MDTLGDTVKPSDLFLIDESPHPKYNAPPKVDESILLIGDCQIPYHDAEFLNKVKQVAFAYGVYTVGMIGDVFDFNDLSIFLSQASKDINRELDQGEYFFKQLASGFKRKLLVLGNHELRLSRMIDQYLDADRLRKLMGLDNTVETTNYFYMLIGDKWQASHPKNTSVTPGQVPKMLAQKYRRHTVSFHGHLTGLAQTLDGMYAIDAGVTCDPERLAYATIRQDTRPIMTQGAVLLLKADDGEYYPRIINVFTDWNFEIETGAMWKAKEEQTEQWWQERLAKCQTRSPKTSKRIAQTRTRRRLAKSAKR